MNNTVPLRSLGLLVLVCGSTELRSVTGSDTHIYYLLTELLWEQYCRLFGQHPKVRKQIADT
jgi:hypothetical protein